MGDEMGWDGISTHEMGWQCYGYGMLWCVLWLLGQLIGQSGLELFGVLGIRKQNAIEFNWRRGG